MCTKIVKSCNSKNIYTNDNYNIGHGSKDLLDLLDLVGPILSRRTQIQLLAALPFLFFLFFSAIEAVDYVLRVALLFSRSSNNIN